MPRRSTMGARARRGWHDAKDRICYIPFGDDTTTTIGSNWKRKGWHVVYHRENALRGEDAIYVVAEGMRTRRGVIEAASARRRDGVEASKLTAAGLAARLIEAGVENGTAIELSICKAGRGFDGNGPCFARELAQALGPDLGRCTVVAYVQSVAAGEAGIHEREGGRQVTFSPGTVLK